MSSAAPYLAPIYNSEFARDVVEGLSQPGQKSLPSRYLYDELGSILFDAITVLPEYGLTRADTRILAQNATAIVAEMPRDLLIVELGSGSGSKTRHLLEAAACRRSPGLVYHPIDISEGAMQQCITGLKTIRGIRIVPHVAAYLDGLAAVTSFRVSQEAVLVLFLGSTIGNFDGNAARDFLREVRGLLRPGDVVLLGTDLLKPLPQMIAAYDDATGVTAAFNLNVLARINRELGGQFNLRSFHHEARFNERDSRIEMHLVSNSAQTVNIVDLGAQYFFSKGESIWTEGSHKFQKAQIAMLAARTGFKISKQWTDDEWPFAETLLLAD